MIITVSAIGCLMILGLIAFFYWLYVPYMKAPKLSASIEKEMIKWDNYERTYLSYVPRSVVKSSKPGLIIVLHGSGIDGDRIRQWTGYEFDQMADDHNFIVLYPDGYKKNWNDCRRNAPYPAKKQNIDDVGFLTSLVRKYESGYGVDPQKVFAFGYSNGGGMAYRMAIEQPQLLNAIAAIGASLPTPDNFNGRIDNITSRIMLVNGTSDPIVPYEGGKIFFFGQNFGYVLSARATAERFAQAGRAVKVKDAVRLPHRVESDPSSVDQEVWLREAEPVVELYTVNGGGHVVPQQTARFPRLMGTVTGDLDAPRAAVRFFKLLTVSSEMRVK